MNKFFLKFNFFYFFYKLIKIYRYSRAAKYYAEFAEDVLVERLLKKINKGSYVDVGCYHPYKGSLTRLLFKKKWKGINIDISKTSIDLFNIARKKDINLCIAVSDFDGTTKFFQNSEINQQNSLIKTSENQKEIEIECCKLSTILNKHNVTNFDYLNIDVEGLETKVIKGFNFALYKPLLITIENNDLLIEDYMKSEIYKILINNGYTFFNKVGVTNFFINSTFKEKIMDYFKV